MSIFYYFIFSVIATLGIDNSSLQKAEPKALEKSILGHLIGQWQGTLPDGKPIVITYEKLSGGAILERYQSQDPMWWNMSTVYVGDGKSIGMSHFCSWGNHPRMRATIDDKENTLKFKFMDIHTTQPQNGYMHDFTIALNAEGELFHHWVWREGGNDTSLSVKLKKISAL